MVVGLPGYIWILREKKQPHIPPEPLAHKQTQTSQEGEKWWQLAPAHLANASRFLVCVYVCCLKCVCRLWLVQRGTYIVLWCSLGMVDDVCCWECILTVPTSKLFRLYMLLYNFFITFERWIFVLNVSYPSLPNTSWKGVLGMFLGVQIPPHQVFGSLGFTCINPS